MPVLTAGGWAFQIIGNSGRGGCAIGTLPAFARTCIGQALLLRGAPEEVEAIAFIEAVADTGERDAASSRSAARAHCPPV
nr:hypothetical protein [uncultured Rhodopila sp.]